MPKSYSVCWNSIHITSYFLSKRINLSVRQNYYCACEFKYRMIDAWTKCWLFSLLAYKGLIFLINVDIWLLLSHIQRVFKQINFIYLLFIFTDHLSWTGLIIFKPIICKKIIYFAILMPNARENWQAYLYQYLAIRNYLKQLRIILSLPEA